MCAFCIPVSVQGPARQAILLTPPRSSHPSRLLSRQYFACVNPLTATLMQLSASVPNKRLTAWLSPLAATLTKNTGHLLQAKSFSLSFSRCSLQLLSVPPSLCGCRSASHLPYPLPSSVSCNSFVCSSYENTGGCGGILPISALIARPSALIARNSSELFHQNTCGGEEPSFLTSLPLTSLPRCSFQSPVTNLQSPIVVSFHPVNILLNEVECRVLRSLIEKEITTPEHYPLSLNALVNACNHKSNRDPVMNLDEAGVRQRFHSTGGQSLEPYASALAGSASK